MPGTLVLGLGNPVRGDDGVGWQVAGEVRRQMGLSELEARHVEVDCLDRGGLSLMERLAGYDRAILIDAIQTGHRPPGTVTSFQLEELPDPGAGHTTSAHDTTLATALQLGRSLGVDLPQEITVVAVEAESPFEFSEQLSPPVLAGAVLAVRAVVELLG